MGIYQKGKNWYIDYYLSGTRKREKIGPSKKLAQVVLKKKHVQIAEGKFLDVDRRLRFKELADDFLRDYEINGRKAIKWAKRVVGVLLQAFGALRANEITSERIEKYIDERRAAELANATINRELAALRRIFSLAARHRPPKILRVPLIPYLKEYNVRTGFFEHEDFLILRDALPDHQRIPLSIGYWTGMRLGEILSLRWAQVDLDRKILRLDPGSTKSGEGRLVPLMGNLPEVLELWQKETRSKWPGCPWVCQYEGQRLTRLTRAWKTACKRAELKGKLFHDLRRTAVRNMVRAGISERVAMEISGHRTRSVFDRYDIVSERDLTEAAARIGTYFIGVNASLSKETPSTQSKANGHYLDTKSKKEVRSNK